MGSCLSGASSAPSFPLDTNHYYESYQYSRVSNMEMRLHRIPSRIFLNGSTPVASLFCKQGRKGINQDAMLLWENFCLMKDSVLCGVFDGHGPFGHVVAKKVRDSLPLKLMDEWNLSGGHHCSTLKESFLKASKSMDRELSLHHRKDAYASGTTAVTLLKKACMHAHTHYYFILFHSQTFILILYIYHLIYCVSGLRTCYCKCWRL